MKNHEWNFIHDSTSSSAGLESSRLLVIKSIFFTNVITRDASHLRQYMMHVSHLFTTTMNFITAVEYFLWYVSFMICTKWLKLYWWCFQLCGVQLKYSNKISLFLGVSSMSYNHGYWYHWWFVSVGSICCFAVPINTLRPRQNGRHFADGTFKSILLNENVQILLKISLNCVTRGLINNIPSWVQIMAWRRTGDKPLSEPMMLSFLMHICIIRPQWVNSLRLSDAYMCQYNIQTLLQIMACHLFGTKPPSKTMLPYCQVIRNIFQWHFIQKFSLKKVLTR